MKLIASVFLNAYIYLIFFFCNFTLKVLNIYPLFHIGFLNYDDNAPPSQFTRLGCVARLNANKEHTHTCLFFRFVIYISAGPCVV